VTPSLSLAQSGSGQGDNCSVPKKEREICGVDFRVVKSLFRARRRFCCCMGLLARESQRCVPRSSTRSSPSQHHWQPLHHSPTSDFCCADSEFEPERSSPEEILRCLWRQLAINSNRNNEVRPSLLFTNENQVARAKTDGLELPKLRAKDCIEAILYLASEDPLTIVIDAMDEIAEEERYQLLSALNQITSRAENVVKVFVTSWNDGQVFTLLPTVMRINVTTEDIKPNMRALSDSSLKMQLYRRGCRMGICRVICWFRWRTEGAG